MFFRTKNVYIMQQVYPKEPLSLQILEGGGGVRPLDAIF